MTEFDAAVAEAERRQVVTDLQAARAELVTRGRCTGSTLGIQGRVCIVGAAIAAIAPGELSEETPTYAALDIPRALRVVRTLHPFLPAEFRRSSPNWLSETDNLFDVARFNDSRGTTDPDAFNLFDKALAELGGLA